MKYDVFRVSSKRIKCSDAPQVFFLPLTLQSALYQLAYDVHAVLKAAGITHWIVEGSLLGAVRHRGLIPWDDDVDMGIVLEDVSKLLKVPAEVWKRHNLECKKHWVGFKIFRRDGFWVPNNRQFPYKYPFVDIFIFEQTNPHVWKLANHTSVKWCKRAVKEFPKMQFLQNDLFPLRPYPFDFPGGKGQLPGPRAGKEVLDRSYPGWDKVAYTNEWNHRQERFESKVCKYPMSRIRAAEKSFFHQGNCLANCTNAVFLRSFVDHIFIINLEHRADRRKHIDQQMALLGIPKTQYTFIKATDRSWESQRRALEELGFLPNSLPKEGPLREPRKSSEKKKLDSFLVRKGLILKRIRSRSREWRNKGLAELAVSLSHARIWNLLANAHKKDARFLVLEDDACVSNLFPFGELKDLIEFTAHKMPSRLHLVLLGYCWPGKTHLLHVGQYNALESGEYLCMHSYIMDQFIAQRMLEHVFPIDVPVDYLFSTPAIMKHAIVFKQPLFIQSPEEGVKSDIQREEDVRGELAAGERGKKFGECASCRQR